MDYLIRGIAGISIGFITSFIIRLINKAVNGSDAVSTVILKMRNGIQGLDRTKVEKQILWNKTYELYIIQLTKETKPELLADALSEAKKASAMVKFTNYSNQ